VTLIIEMGKLECELKCKLKSIKFCARNIHSTYILFIQHFGFEPQIFFDFTLILDTFLIIPSLAGHNGQTGIIFHQMVFWSQLSGQDLYLRTGQVLGDHSPISDRPNDSSFQRSKI